MTDEPMSDEHIARARRQADAVMRGEHDTTGMVAESLDMLLAEVERLRAELRAANRRTEITRSIADDAWRELKLLQDANHRAEANRERERLHALGYVAPTEKP